MKKHGYGDVYKRQIMLFVLLIVFFINAEVHLTLEGADIQGVPHTFFFLTPYQMCIRDSINPVADTVATATFQGAEVDWYIKAEDIVLKKGAAMNPQTPKKDVPPVKSVSYTNLGERLG